MTLDKRLWWDASGNTVHCGGLVWNHPRHEWGPAANRPSDRQPTSARAAIRQLQKARPFRGLPIGVIGPRQASPEAREMAEAAGQAIADLGLALLCGGKGGVMEAACKGAQEAGGLTIGLLPDDEWSAANPYVDIPLASGIGPARNAIIARACPVLIAVSGEYGTLAEMAFGLHFNRHVISLGHAPEVVGAVRARGLDEAIDLAALAYLRLPPFEPPAETARGAGSSG